MLLQKIRDKHRDSHAVAELENKASLYPLGLKKLKRVNTVSYPLGKSIDISEVKEKLVNNFKNIFEYEDVTAISKDELMVVNFSNI